MKVAILGANSLLGRHLIRHIQEQSLKREEDISIRAWCYNETGDLFIDGFNNGSIERFNGIPQLSAAFKDVDVVVNVHECQDFSICPDDGLLMKHNVEVVRNILFQLRAPLVHLSSVFVQCSDRWPNVYGQEADPAKYQSEWPFKAYCESKWEGEKLIQGSEVNAYIMRCVPLFGESDEVSILTDLIGISANTFIPILGDGDGTIQMAYAGNVAVGVWLAVGQLVGRVAARERIGSVLTIIEGVEVPSEMVAVDAVSPDALGFRPASALLVEDEPAILGCGNVLKRFADEDNANFNDSITLYELDKKMPSFENHATMPVLVPVDSEAADCLANSDDDSEMPLLIREDATETPSNITASTISSTLNDSSYIVFNDSMSSVTSVDVPAVRPVVETFDLREEVRSCGVWTGESSADSSATGSALDDSVLSADEADLTQSSIAESEEPMDLELRELEQDVSTASEIDTSASDCSSVLSEKTAADLSYNALGESNVIIDPEGEDSEQCAIDRLEALNREAFKAKTSGELYANSFLDESNFVIDGDEDKSKPLAQDRVEASDSKTDDELLADDSALSHKSDGELSEHTAHDVSDSFVLYDSFPTDGALECSEMSEKTAFFDGKYEKDELDESTLSEHTALDESDLSEKTAASSEDCEDLDDRSVSERTCIELSWEEYGIGQAAVSEVFILADDMPKVNIYKSMEKLLITGKREPYAPSIPFVVVYYAYLLFAWIIILLSKFITFPDWIAKLPHPSVLYFNFRHWTFFNTFKSENLLGYKPPFTHEEALERCAPYYRRIAAADVKKFSWRHID